METSQGQSRLASRCLAGLPLWPPADPHDVSSQLCVSLRLSGSWLHSINAAMNNWDHCNGIFILKCHVCSIGTRTSFCTTEHFPIEKPSTTDRVRSGVQSPGWSNSHFHFQLHLALLSPPPPPAPCLWHCTHINHTHFSPLQKETNSVEYFLRLEKLVTHWSKSGKYPEVYQGNLPPDISAYTVYTKVWHLKNYQ